MSEFLTSMSNFLGSGVGKGLLTATELGTTGAGLVGNIMNEKARSAQYNEIANAEKTLGDPTALAKQVVAATQPLNSGLVQSVENNVSGNLASEGLSQAPGIQAASLAQALAPFQQQNQQTAMQLVLERLGLPIQYGTAGASVLPPNVDLSKLLAMLSQNNSGSDVSNPTDLMSLVWGNPSISGTGNLPLTQSAPSGF
jgi:hypothetical protein